MQASDSIMQPPSPALSGASPWAEGDENSVRVAVRHLAPDFTTAFPSDSLAGSC